MSVTERLRALIVQVQAVASGANRARIRALKARVAAMEHERGRWSDHAAACAEAAAAA